MTRAVIMAKRMAMVHGTKPGSGWVIIEGIHFAFECPSRAPGNRGKAGHLLAAGYGYGHAIGKRGTKRTSQVACSAVRFRFLLTN